MNRPEIISVMPALSRLNTWARLPFKEQGEMGSAKGAIYAMKRRVITRAVELGMCEFRIVSVERPCKTCDPKMPGAYRRYDCYGGVDEYWHEDCRRCNATGRVTLRFLETSINGVKWHTPRPKADFFVATEQEWDQAEATDWVPEQPGQPFELFELFQLLNEAERHVFGDKLIEFGKWGNPYDYTLHLGGYRDCFVCGRTAVFPDERGYWYAPDVYRPRLRWKQAVCDWSVSDCEKRARRWPIAWPHNWRRWNDERHNHPAWHDRAPLPDLAHNPIVEEWLARRGVRIGLPPPCEYVFNANSLQWGSIVAVKGESVFLKENEFLVRVRPDNLRPWEYRLIEAPVSRGRAA